MSDRMAAFASNVVASMPIRFPFKSNVLLERRYSHPVAKSTGVRSDQTVILLSYDSASVYPDRYAR
jgi:hypothetical protein